MKDWKNDLEEFFKDRKRGTAPEEVDAGRLPEVRKFFASRVKPAFKAVRKELGRYGREIALEVGDDHASFDIRFQGRLELNYRIFVRGKRPCPESYFEVPSGGALRSEGAFKTGGRPAEVGDVTKDDIIAHLLREYRSAMQAVKA